MIQRAGPLGQLARPCQLLPEVLCGPHPSAEAAQTTGVRNGCDQLSRSEWAHAGSGTVLARPDGSADGELVRPQYPACGAHSHHGRAVDWTEPDRIQSKDRGESVLGRQALQVDRPGQSRVTIYLEEERRRATGDQKNSGGGQ
jgi:hypothetical protein